MARLTVLGFVFVLASSSPLSAAGDAATSPASGVDKSPELPAAMKVLDTVCGLTDDQKSKAIKLNDDFVKSCADFKAANGDKIDALRKAISDAKANKDADAQAKSEAELAGMVAPARQTAQKFTDDIQGLLTADQKDKWDEHISVTEIKGIYGPAELTDDQVAQVKAARKKIIDGGTTDHKEVMTQLVGKMKDILTPEQQAIMNKAKRPGPYGSKVF